MAETLKDARGYGISVGDAVVYNKTGAGAWLLEARVVDIKTRVKVVLTDAWNGEDYFSWVAPYSLVVVDGFPELERKSND